MTEPKPKSDVLIIKDFFDLKPASEAMAQLKLLSSEEKKALAEGIRNGSLTY